MTAANGTMTTLPLATSRIRVFNISKICNAKLHECLTIEICPDCRFQIPNHHRNWITGACQSVATLNVIKQIYFNSLLFSFCNWSRDHYIKLQKWPQESSFRYRLPGPNTVGSFLFKYSWKEMIQGTNMVIFTLLN